MNSSWTRRMIAKIARKGHLWLRLAGVRHSATAEENIFSRERVSFGNTSVLEFIRAIVVLRICSLPGFADNAEKVLEVTKQIFGNRLFGSLMRATAYGQFVGGDKFDEIKRTTAKLNRSNVIQMLAVAIEDVNESRPISREELYEENTEKVLSCIEISRDTCPQGKDALMQLKLTGIMEYNALVELSNILEEHKPGYDGITLWLRNDCSENVLRDLFPSLKNHTIEQLITGCRRLLRVIEYADKCDVTVLIDAEYTWINPAIQYISIALMKLFNSQKAVVVKTYQGYLKETRKLIQVHAKQCEAAEVHFGFKLVRGAYLLSETLRNGSHPPWLCDNWDETNKNYDNCLRDALLLNPKMSRVLLATHNEESVRLAVGLLGDRRTGAGKCNVSFAQLYGMGDYMSYTLGRMGYDVYKSLPYGSVEEVLPYLCRRAKENTLFLSGIRKEMDMLKIGLRRKIMNKTQDTN